MQQLNDKKQAVLKGLKIDGVSAEELAAALAIPPDPEMGDYALPCFKFAKVLRKSPVLIAQEAAASYVPTSPVKSVEAVNGYLNFRLDSRAVALDTLERVLAECKNYGSADDGEGKTVCIDYSSINIAKPFHMGHLSTTVIGAALYRIFKKLGYRSVGINHLGDWGTQFGKLIVAYKKWGSAKELEKKGMNCLTALYVKYHEEAEKDEMLDFEARLWFKKIEDGNPEAVQLWEKFKEITLKEVKKVYKRLKVSFDSYHGEAFYNDKMQPVLDELEQKGLLVESEGAKVVDLSEYNMPPCLLVKADGATLYATRDLATAYYRKKRYDFCKSLYVVAYQQNLHFEQVFKVLELLGNDWAKDLVHVKFGMVSMEGGEAMSTRKGKVILLEDVLDKTVARALKIIKEKNPNLKDAAATAEKIGVGAVIFSALYNGRIKDIVFSYDKVLNFEGETGPYIQYTNARCNSVLKKAHDVYKKISSGEIPLSEMNLDGIDNKEAREIVGLIDGYTDVLREAARDYEPSVLSRYLVRLAQAYNKFYFEHSILKAAEGQKEIRLALTVAVHRVLEDGLSLLGIAAPKSM